jgi:hypothetical protein
MGWTARYILLSRPNGRQHASVDIWSNQYQKWIYMDPTWNVHVKENGVPLSILEIRQHWLNQKFCSMTFVFSGGADTVYFHSSDFPFRRGDSELWRSIPIGIDWLAYVDTIMIINRNNLFDSRNIFSDMYVIRDRNNLRAVRNRKSMPVEVLFSACNVPDYVINSLEGNANSIEIILRHNTKTSFTPSFSHFEIEKVVKYNWVTRFLRLFRGRHSEIENKWVPTEHTFIVKRTQLKNGIRIRAINVLGVAGPVITITDN